MIEKETIIEKRHLLLIVLFSSFSKNHLLNRMPSFFLSLDRDTHRDLLQWLFDRLSRDCGAIFRCIAWLVSSPREVHNSSLEASTGQH